MSLRPRTEIEGIGLCPHGGPDYAELKARGFDPSEVIDFSVSSNPFGPSPGVKLAMASVVVDRYPDSESAELKGDLVQTLGVGPENIIVGNGSMEIIRLVASAYFDPSDEVAIIGPTFGEYEMACRIAGSKVVECNAPVDDGFNVDLKSARELIETHRPRAVFLCNPNNPTGRYLAQGEVERLLSVCADTLLILDEAYVAFVQDPWSAVDLIETGNLLILRSMTKDYALAGLRLGYAVGQSEIIGNLRKVCPPWSVNAVAQTAGLVSLRDGDHLAQSRRGVRQATSFLVDELTKLGLPVIPSDTHFFLVKVGHAGRFRRALLDYGILVRDCTSFGLPEYVRIATRTLPDCRRLIDAVGRICG